MWPEPVAAAGLNSTELGGRPGPGRVRLRPRSVSMKFSPGILKRLLPSSPARFDQTLVTSEA